MSIQAVAWALDCQFRDDPYAKLILISLANHADHVTGFCWPSMKQIAREASCDRRTVLRRLPALVAAGYVRIVPGAPGDKHHYQLLMPGCDPQTHPPERKRPAARVRRVRLPVTGGCDSVVTHKNHHTTITSPLPSSSRRVESPAGLGKEARGFQQAKPRPSSASAEHASVVQARVAEKLGRGDRAAGWLAFGSLSDSARDQLSAQERAGTLTQERIASVLGSLSLA
ncbi:helix-turn-helix domain-containing protein [Bradyrhizobium sp. USDA 3364]